jgi:hypothetical protein
MLTHPFAEALDERRDGLRLDGYRGDDADRSQVLDKTPCPGRVVVVTTLKGVRTRTGRKMTRKGVAHHIIDPFGGNTDAQ